MTQWVKDPTGGRARGPRAMARAWVNVLVRSRQFFDRTVAPGDQAPALLFVMAVTLVEETIRFVLVPAAAPSFDSFTALSAPFALAIAVLLIAPATLHLVAAVETVLLMAFASDRAGVSETVQVIAYATAPCVFAGVPIPAVRVVCTLYGAALLVLGTAVRHDLALPKAFAVSAVPAAIVFGYAFRGFAALSALATQIAALVA